MEIKIKNTQLKTEVGLELSKIGISTDVVDLLVTENEIDAEKVLSKVTKFKEILENATKAMLEQKIKDSNFVPSTGANKEMTKEEFNKLEYSEKVKIYNTNKALYEKLSK
jgi:riboflavin synthase